MEGVIPKSSHAGLRSRSLAFSLDYVLICGYILVLVTARTLVLRGPLRQRADLLFATPTRRDIIAFLTLILPVMLYFTYYESSSHAATWGKRKLGLQVVTVQGKHLGRRRAFTRAALKFFPWQVAHTSLFHIPGWPLAPGQVPVGSQIGLGFVWVTVGAYGISMLMNKQHRTIYDQIVGSSVIMKT